MPGITYRNILIFLFRIGAIIGFMFNYGICYKTLPFSQHCFGLFLYCLSIAHYSQPGRSLSSLSTQILRADYGTTSGMTDSTNNHALCSPNHLSHVIPLAQNATQAQKVREYEPSA